MLCDSGLADLVRSAVPDLDSRVERFVVDTSEVDDELLVIFLEQMDINVGGMLQARGSGDMQQAGNEAHSIKGMGGTAGMPELSVLAEELERAGKASDMQRFDQLVAVLDQYFVAVKKKVHGEG